MSQRELFNDKLNRDRFFELLTIAFNEILTRGNLNCVGEVTLTANTTTTTVTNRNVGANQKVFLFPTTANAAAESAYVSEVRKGQFTVTHANNAQTDRTFDYFHVG